MMLCGLYLLLNNGPFNPAMAAVDHSSLETHVLPSLGGQRLLLCSHASHPLFLRGWGSNAGMEHRALSLLDKHFVCH